MASCFTVTVNGRHGDDRIARTLQCIAEVMRGSLERVVPRQAADEGRLYFYISFHVPTAVVIIVLTIAVLLGAWKAAKHLWLMLAG